MSGAAVDLGDAVPVADELIGAGDLPAALGVLRTVLAGVAPESAGPDADLAEACRRYAAVLCCLGEAYSAAPYAAYAYGSMRALPDRDGTAALRSGVVYAFVLRATGALAAATLLYRDLHAAVRLRYGPYARVALAARADLAVALHLAGECLAARQAMHGAYFTHRDAYGPADEPGIRMLARLGTMTRDCGDFERAHQYFDTAKSLCAGHLGAADPLAREVTALARAGSDTGHACGRPATRPGTDVGDLFLGLFGLPDRAVDTVSTTAARVPPAAAQPEPAAPAATFGRLRRSAPPAPRD